MRFRLLFHGAVAEAGAPRRLSWQKKLGFSVLVTVGFFTLLELLLATLGVEPVRDRRDPFVGFDASAPLFVRQGDQYVTSAAKLCFFNPQSFPAVKSPRAYRIFCLGGSTTYGHPYDHRTYFGSWLRAYLEESAPGHDWEVVNCGGISYASYRIARLMEELVQYEPDLFIVYTGHNEFLEDRTYGPLRRQSPAVRNLYRVVYASRVAGLMDAAWRRPPPAPASHLAAEVKTRLEVVGPEAYHRDRAWRAGVLEHFRFSVARMAELARHSGARIIFVQPACNLKDFTPFKSEHTAGLTDEQVQRWQTLVDEARRVQAAGDPRRAVRLLQEAVQLNPDHALGLWYLGDALLAANDSAAALEYFTRAKDEDICPLRAPSEIREILFAVADEQRAMVVDFPQILTDKYGALPAVGYDCFLDHVHPTLGAHADLGQALAATLTQMGVVPAAPPTPQCTARVKQRVLGPLQPYDHVMALHTLAMTLSWAGKNEEALRLAEVAVEALPQHSEILTQYGRLLEKLHRDADALAAYQKAVAANPNDSLTLARLGEYHSRHGDWPAARAALQRAVDLTPDKAPLAFRAQIRVELGDALQATGDAAAAQRLYREAAALDPDFPGLRERLRD